jgi:hypothetical protein
MNPELRNKLIEKYPEIFRDNGSVDCGNGWYNILDSWCKTIDLENERGNIQYLKNLDLYKHEPFIPTRVTQIKEKWGTLRIYTTSATDFEQGVTRMAERLSEKTCELCGNPGRLRRMSWIRILCDEDFVAQSLGAPATFMGENE